MQADGNQSRTSFGAGVEDRTLLPAFAAEEERAASTITGKPLKPGARGEVHFLDMIASVRSKSPGQARKRAASSCSRTAAINDSTGRSLRPAA